MDYRELIKGKNPVPKDQLTGGDYPPFFIFDETGDWVAGTLSDLREIEHSDGHRSKVMTITTPDGDKYSIGLSANLRGLAEMEGKDVVIKFSGMKKAGKYYAKDFEVYQ